MPLSFSILFFLVLNLSAGLWVMVRHKKEARQSERRVRLLIRGLRRTDCIGHTPAN
jgi:hypothetical protein